MDQQSATDSIAAKFGFDEEIFKVETVSPAKGREVVEPQRKACALAVPLGDLAEHTRMLGKQRGLKIDESSVDLVE